MNPAHGSTVGHQLAQSDQAKYLAYSQLADDIQAMKRSGERPDVQVLVSKYPQLANEIHQLLPAMTILEDIGLESEQTATGTVPSLVTIGDFHVVRELGRGGMGVVYEAEQESMSRRVALKVLPYAAILDSKVLQRFRSEAQIAGQLVHQNIVPVHSVGFDRGVHYYAMQLIEGMTLAELIRQLRDKAPSRESTDQSWTRTKEHSRTGSLGDAETAAVAGLSTVRSTSPTYVRSATKLMIQVAQALDYAHGENVIHRDIKPSNLMVDSRGKIWVTDFGLAHVETGPSITITGDFLGTLRYMSPEQALAQRVVVDHRTDIYSLGLTFYELLTQQPAFTGSGRQELLRQITFEDPVPPRRLNKAIPTDLETILLKSIEKNPAERYATAGELAADLARFVADRPIRARRPTLLQRSAKWCRRHRTVVAAAFVVLAIAVLGLGVATAQLVRQRNQAIAQKLEIERELRVSSAMRLAAQSQSLRDQLPARSLLLAVEAIDATRAHGEPIHPVAVQSLHEALAVVGGRPLWNHNGQTKFAFASDRNTLVTSHTGELRLWDLEKPWNNSVVLRTETPFTPAVSSDRRWILTKTANNDLQLWDLRSPDPRKQLGSFPDDRLWPYAFSSDNRWLVVCINHIVKVWDLHAQEIGEPRYELAAHSQGAHTYRIAISSDSRWLVSGGSDAIVRVWDLAAEDPVGSERTFHLGSAETEVRALALSSDGQWLAVGGGNYASTDQAVSVRLWDLQANDLVQPAFVLPGHQTEVEALAFSPDGRWLVSAGMHGKVFRWDLASPTPADSAKPLLGHDTHVVTAAISPDGKWLATGAMDKVVALWRLDANETSTPILLRGHEMGLAMHPLGVTFTENSEWLVSIGTTGNARVWDLRAIQQSAGKSGTYPLVHTHSGRRIVLVKFLQNGATLLSASVGDRTGPGGDIQLLATPAIVGLPFRKPPQVLYPGRVAGAAVSDDGRQLAVGTIDGAVELRQLDREDSDAAQLLTNHGSRVMARGIVFGPNGRWLASASVNGSLRISDLRLDTPKTISLPTGHTTRNTHPDWLTFSADGRRFAASTGSTIRVWDLEDSDSMADAPRVFEGHEENISYIAFGPSHEQLAAGSDDGTVRIWNVDNPAKVPTALRWDADSIDGIRFSPDGRWLVTGSWGPDYQCSVRLWDLTAENPAATSLHLRDQLVPEGSPFHPGTGQLATVDRFSEGGRAHNVRLWNLQAANPSKAPTTVLRGHFGVRSRGLLFSQDGRFLVTRSGGGIGGIQEYGARIWDLDSPENPSIALKSYSGLSAIALGPHRRWLAAGDYDSRVYLWDLHIGSLIQSAHRVAGRKLTDNERAQYLSH